MKKFDIYHNIFLTIISTIEEYIQDTIQVIQKFIREHCS
jgi:hypothetical protein